MTIAFIAISHVMPREGGAPSNHRARGLATWIREYWIIRGACHRAGHFGPDPLADDDMLVQISGSFYRL
jgi:hypothetical protein